MPTSDEAWTQSVDRAARERVQDGLAGILLRQAWAEFVVALRRGARFRESVNAKAVRAYCAMSVAEFEAVNARQRWANWRIIPRNLHGRLPERPCLAVDLCSGVGDAAEVLAYCLPPGSEILGFEYNPRFVRQAMNRIYLGSGGQWVTARFRAQSVLEPFRDASGERLGDASVDLVNSCGALAINFDEPALEIIAAEIARVLRPGGLATVDADALGSGRRRMSALFLRHGLTELGEARSCVFDRFTQVCFRLPG